MPTFIQNEDGSYSQRVDTPFDPVATAQEIESFKTQASAAGDLASRNAIADFQPQIDALQAQLDAFNAQFPNAQ